MYRIASPHGTGEYGLLPDGTIEVRKDGAVGTFDEDGVWLSGELKIAEPCMCRWLSTAGLAGTRHAQSVDAAKSATTEAGGSR
ncbi:MAG: hypothetical protein ACR2N9_05330 [Acidimicrobiia bacterium]